jgi:hypothetical protein
LNLIDGWCDNAPTIARAGFKLRHCNSQIKLNRSHRMSTLLLVVLIVLLIGVLPTWPHSRNWGYRPGGLLGVILIIVIVLALTGRA